jgi:hypothetical protein
MSEGYGILKLEEGDKMVIVEIAWSGSPEKVEYPKFANYESAIEFVYEFNQAHAGVASASVVAE